MLLAAFPWCETKRPIVQDEFSDDVHTKFRSPPKPSLKSEHQTMDSICSIAVLLLDMCMHLSPYIFGL